MHVEISPKAWVTGKKITERRRKRVDPGHSQIKVIRKEEDPAKKKDRPKRRAIEVEGKTSNCSVREEYSTKYFKDGVMNYSQYYLEAKER